MQLLKVAAPHYSVDKEPNYKAIGELIDAALKRHFMGQAILLRGIGSQEHQGKTTDELIKIIQEIGTDHYDSARVGDRYENIENKQIDLFAFAATITLELALGWQVVYGFYHSAISVHGYPIRIDILTMYDASQFEEVTSHSSV